MSDPVPERGRIRSDRLRAVMLGLAAFLVYNANFRSISSGDCFPARFLPFAMWQEGSLHLDSVLAATAQGQVDPYWILTSRDGRKASKYPIVTPLLVAPLYAPAWLHLHRSGWTVENLSETGELMEKLAATVIAAVTVGVLFLTLRRRVAPATAALLTGAFAVGTNTWVTGSQALWQHGTGELLVAVALLAMTREPSWLAVLAGGAATGLMVANRPPDAVLAAGFAIYALCWARRRAAVFALAATGPVALAIGYNLWMFGHPAGGYGLTEVAAAGFFSGPLPIGVAGLLVSPGKGLFVFSPFLLFLPVLFRRSLADPRHRRLTWCLAGSVVLQILLYATTDWRAGYSWGPRFLTDMLPILVWMLAPAVETLGRASRTAFAVACLFSIGVQFVGAFLYQGRSDILLYHGPGESRLLAWRPEHTPYWLELRSGFAPMPLLRVFGAEAYSK
jgi:hypothetical protein